MLLDFEYKLEEPKVYEIIKISDAEIVKCATYAKECYENFNAKGRTRNELLKNIITGKLAEIVFYKKYGKYLTEPNFTKNEKTDGGFDFKIKDTDITIDVKSVDSEGKSFVTVNFDYYRCDYYAYILIKAKTREAIIFGIITQDIALTNRKLSKYGTYTIKKEIFEKNDLKDGFINNSSRK